MLNASIVNPNALYESALQKDNLGFDWGNISLRLALSQFQYLSHTTQKSVLDPILRPGSY
jgi:hypothetical protein